MRIRYTFPAKTFNVLWKEALSTGEERAFIRTFTDVTSKRYINLRKISNVKYDDYIVFLHKIYKYANMSFKDILTLAGISKSKASLLFCIPIRTIEDWYCGVNRCPGYIKLMFFRSLGLFDFNGIHIMAEDVELT